MQARDSNIGNSRLWVEGPLNPIPGVADLNECSEPGLDANSILLSLHFLALGKKVIDLSEVPVNDSLIGGMQSLSFFPATRLGLGPLTRFWS